MCFFSDAVIVFIDLFVGYCGVLCSLFVFLFNLPVGKEITKIWDFVRQTSCSAAGKAL